MSNQNQRSDEVELNNNRSIYEYHAIQCRTPSELLLILDIFSADQWEPKLYLGRGVVVLQRPFSDEPTLEPEYQDFDLIDNEDATS